MAKGNVTLFFSVAVVLALLVGGLVTYVAFPRTVRVPIEKVVTKEVPIERVVTKEVPVEKVVTKEVPLSLKESYLEPSIEELLNEIRDDDNLQVCDGETYDEEQIEVKKVYDSYTVKVLDEDETEVSFKVKLKYLDKDTNEKCYRVENVVVHYEEGEEPEVTIL